MPRLPDVTAITKSRFPSTRFQAAGLSWPLSEKMTDAALEARLFANAGAKQGHRRQIEPDWVNIHRELKRKHATLSILWDEYIESNPAGYRYFRFCELLIGDLTYACSRHQKLLSTKKGGTDIASPLEKTRYGASYGLARCSKLRARVLVWKKCLMRGSGQRFALKENDSKG